MQPLFFFRVLKCDVIILRTFEPGQNFKLLALMKVKKKEKFEVLHSPILTSLI